MLNNFSPILTIDSFGLGNNPEIYLAFKETEQHTIQKLISYARNSKEGTKHIEFISEYYNLFQIHLDFINSTIESITQLSDKLTEHLNYKEKLNFEEKIEFNGCTYYITYSFDGWILFSYLTYDKHLEKDAYLILNYTQSSKGLKTTEKSIGFTNQSLDSLRKHPNYLQEQLDQLDKLSTINEINTQFKRCEKLLLQCFNVNTISDLFDLEESYFTQFFGEPLEILRSINSKKTDNIIRVSLMSNSVEHITFELISLIRNKLRLLKFSDAEDLLDKETIQKNTRATEKQIDYLMTKLNISQGILNEYMDYLPKDL